MNGYSKKIVVECPKCGMDALHYEAWNSPATREEPADGGFELVKQDCACKMTDKEWEVFEQKTIESFQENYRSQKMQEAIEKRDGV